MWSTSNTYKYNSSGSSDEGGVLGDVTDHSSSAEWYGNRAILYHNVTVAMWHTNICDLLREKGPFDVKISN